MSSLMVLTLQQLEMVTEMKVLINDLEKMTIPEENTARQSDYPAIPIMLGVASTNLKTAHRLCKNMIGEIVVDTDRVIEEG